MLHLVEITNDHILRLEIYFFVSSCFPTVELAPKQIIFHCGTNNLPSSEDPETITKNIVNLTKNVKTDTTKVAISGIIPRRDTFNLSAKQVNETLKKIHEVENIFYSFWVMVSIQVSI